MQEVAVGDGKKKRRMAAVVVLHERVLREGLKGSAKSAYEAIKNAEQLGVQQIEDAIGIDYSVLTSEERELMNKTLPIIQKLKATKS